MRTSLMAALIAASSCAAMAAPVPAELDAALKNLKMQRRSLDDGVLRIVMAVPIVSPAMFYTAISLVCNERYNSPKAMAALRVDRIEVLNYVDAQGFAIGDGLKGCARVEKLRDEQLTAVAERCEAGVCRKRD